MNFLQISRHVYWHNIVSVLYAGLAFTQRTHREKNVILQDEQNMSQQRFTSTEDHIHDLTGNAQSLMPNRANTSIILL